MLGIDLSALNTPELRRLLDVAQARGQTTLVTELKAELEARRLRTPAQYVHPMSLDRAPLDFEDVPPPRRRTAAPLFMAASALLVGGLAWGVSMPPRLSETRRPTSMAMQVRTTFHAPESGVALAEAAIVETAPVVALDTLSAPVVAVRRVIPSQSTAAPNPCYAEPTPADRLVCGYPVLGAQHRRLREAYLQALAAGVDADTLDEDQARWKSDRDGVSDRHRLAEVYGGRIRELEAAIAAAQADEPVT